MSTFPLGDEPPMEFDVSYPMAFSVWKYDEHKWDGNTVRNATR
jgi:hypothetical protein